MGLLDRFGAPRRKNVYLALATVFSIVLFLGYRQSPYKVDHISQYVETLRGSSQHPETHAAAAHDPSGLKDGYYVKYRQGPHWHGWSNVEHMVVFGDSWSITGFVPEGQQPTVENPLGNPEFPGETSTNGPNYVDYLTYNHNRSLIMTANIAAGGGVVSTDLISPTVIPGSIRDLKKQMVDQWPTIYGDHPKSYPWTADSSIFIIWIGLNDIHNADADSQHLFPEVMEHFKSHVDTLYSTGAKNFFFVNIPPIQRAPLAEIIDTTEDWTRWVTQWNQNLTHLAWNFSSTYSDTTVFLFDMYKLYDDVMDNPCILPESCGFEVTTKFCPMYSFGTDAVDSKHEKCPLSADKYFWMNDLHPMTKTHDMTAHAIAKALSTEQDIP